MKKRLHRAKPERGVALIVALIMILVLSVLVAGLVFATQTQTWTGYNYKTTTQARYAAEAGIQRTMNWIMSANYTAPTVFTPFDMTKYPVMDKTASPQPIVLSAAYGMASNYPTSAVQTAFNSALNNQSVPGLGNATFSTYAMLLKMTPGSGVSWMGGGGGAPQTWQITSIGSVADVRPANVQVQATYERGSAPIFTYGIAGDGNICGDVTFTGGSIDSWDSTGGGTYALTQQNTDGSIGTNGNVTLSGGSTRVHGPISDSSNITVGNCPDGITNNVGGTPWNSLNLLNQPLVYPNPAVPNPMTPTTNLNVNSNTCWGALPAGCTVIAGPAINIVPGSYGNITSNSNVHLSAGTYDINSLNLNGGSITLDSTPVVINLGGQGISSGGTLFASQSSTTINSGGVPANLQIVSAAGIGMANPPVITMNASSAMYAVVYAPNAYVHITGSSHFLGAVVGERVTCDSSGGFSYDRALENSLLTVGNFQPVSYTWNKF